MHAWEARIKRAIDIAVAGCGLVVTAPVLATAAVAVRCEMGSPVFFRQQRPGLRGKPFEMVKLRTMLSDDQVAAREPERAGAHGVVGHPSGGHSDAERLTPLGRWLRATSIDELPTLWNVLRGDMSLVGPRPLLMQYLPLYSPEQARRHDVRPGLTGLAQVRGRNALGWDEKFRADVEYVDTASLRVDAQILLDTMLVVLRRDGIAHGAEATMPVFTGSAA